MQVPESGQLISSRGLRRSMSPAIEQDPEESEHQGDDGRGGVDFGGRGVARVQGTQSRSTSSEGVNVPIEARGRATPGLIQLKLPIRTGLKGMEDEVAGKHSINNGKSIEKDKGIAGWNQSVARPVD